MNESTKFIVASDQRIKHPLPSFICDIGAEAFKGRKLLVLLYARFTVNRQIMLSGQGVLCCQQLCVNAIIDGNRRARRARPTMFF
mmetsp:Transcript_849/g.3285  ORF Transcript_849/g.3285 Transcript_849/m.3285 type:complete len:85 (+) Transcript_849:4678-4932(+)